MADQTSAKDALFTAIENAANEVSEKYHPDVAGRVVLELSYAWRALVGGNQPGSLVLKE